MNICLLFSFNYYVLCFFSVTIRSESQGCKMTLSFPKTYSEQPNMTVVESFIPLDNDDLINY